MEFSVRPPSPPNTYSYVREENLGSTRKSVEIYVEIACITNLILAIHMQSMNGLEEPFEDSRKKFLQPRRSRCTWRNVVREAHTGLTLMNVVREAHLGWEIRSEFRRVPQLIQFQTF
jgi:hypothetical protein